MGGGRVTSGLPRVGCVADAAAVPLPAHARMHTDTRARVRTHTPGSAIPHAGPAYNLASRAALQRRAVPEALVLSGRPRVSGTGPGPQAFPSAEKTPPCPPAWTRSPCHTWVLRADVGTLGRLPGLSQGTR